MTLHVYDGDDFEELFRQLQRKLISLPPVATGEWQSQDITGKEAMITRELANASIVIGLPQTSHHLGMKTGARLPWAEDHFLERVSGEPLNPSPSEAWWPFAQKVGDDTNKDHKSQGEAFSHTYPERMWPKWAGETYAEMADSTSVAWDPIKGIRFYYGDLGDVVDQLDRSPMTRQAYLPIWFPEDTGAVHRERVPCTLGYHFFIRNDTLQITYYMRSCDLIRHFQDDVYMAGRLAQWVRDELNNRIGKLRYEVGELIMHITSLHCFEGDIPMMELRDKEGKAWSA